MPLGAGIKYAPPPPPTLAEIFRKTDRELFEKIDGDGEKFQAPSLKQILWFFEFSNILGAF